MRQALDIKLTDYQIAEAFGDTLSIIYKDKVAELNEELSEMYAHLDKLMIPQVPEFHQWFARQTVPRWAKQHLQAIEHINKIRNMYKKIKTSPHKETLDVQKAKSVPISSMYDWTIKKNMVSCPFHTDKRPSMKINKNNTVKCFSCGFFGDGIAFWMKINNVDFKRAVEGLNNL